MRRHRPSCLPAALGGSTAPAIARALVPAPALAVVLALMVAAAGAAAQADAGAAPTYPAEKQRDHEGAEDEGAKSLPPPPGPTLGGLDVQGTALVTGAAAGVAAFLLHRAWPALRLLLASLYSRISRDEALLQENRERIYRAIRDRPGIHASALVRMLGLQWGTVAYHLRQLEDHGLIASRKSGRYRTWFAVGDAHVPFHDAIALLRNPNARAIAGMVASHPGVIQREIAKALALETSLASWHLRRLEGAGVVRGERVGRRVRYRPGPTWARLQELGGV